MPPELPVDYYLRNFWYLVDFVMARYADLLSEREKEFYESFRSLELDAQRLCVRLFSRKGELFRLEKIAYDEISDLEKAVESLADKRLLYLTPDIGAPDLIALFNKSELIDAFSVIDGVNSSRYKTKKRDSLVSALLDHDDLDKLCQVLRTKSTVVYINYQAVFNVFKLLFFGNLYQDMTEFVLRDLGLYQFESYQIDQTNRYFVSRQQVERHLEYFAKLAGFDAYKELSSDELLDLVDSLPEPYENDSVLDRRLARQKNRVARQLERLGCFDQALKLYQQAEREPARERQARIAFAQGNVQTGFSVCQQILLSPQSQHEKDFAKDFMFRMAKKHGAEFLQELPVPVKYSPPSVTKTLKSSGYSVEEDARLHLEKIGQCFYVENALFNGVLGLWIWDILFANIPGAFINPFQMAPSDYGSPDFFSARANLIQERMESLSTELLLLKAEQVWKEKHGTLNPLINWSALSIELIDTAIKRIPVEHWRCIFDRIMSDFKENRNGLPDLILFPDQGSYELVEVKGPGDKLQKNQIRWMQYFSENDVPHQTLYIEYESG